MFFYYIPVNIPDWNHDTCMLKNPDTKLPSKQMLPFMASFWQVLKEPALLYHHSKSSTSKCTLTELNLDLFTSIRYGICATLAVNWHAVQCTYRVHLVHSYTFSWCLVSAILRTKVLTTEIVQHWHQAFLLIRQVHYGTRRHLTANPVSR